MNQPTLRIACSARHWLLVGIALFLTACASTPNENSLNLIYERAAQYHEPDRNPIIVIPGILGSRLIDDDSGRTVWGAFTRSSVNPTTPTMRCYSPCHWTTMLIHNT